jgi:hypothetical protein
MSRLPELPIGRLGDGDAANLLRDVTGGRLNPGVQGRLLRESAGNPLALLEMGRQLTPEQLAGAVDLPDPLRLAGSIQQLFARRMAQLGSGARRLLAVAAAEPTVSESVAWAVARLDVDAESVEPELDTFVRFGDGVQFSHPLVRSVAYYGMPASERRTLHRALAREMDSPKTSDRAAWHLALARRLPTKPSPSNWSRRPNERGTEAGTRRPRRASATRRRPLWRRASPG